MKEDSNIKAFRQWDKAKEQSQADYTRQLGFVLSFKLH